MDNGKAKVVLVTGASSGIGKSVAERLAAAGNKVYGTSRKQAAGPAGDGDPSPAFEMLRLDVRDEASIEAAVEYIIKKEGTLDILVNNAGYGIAGAVEDTSFEEAFSQFDTNFFGVLRMCRKVLPFMRRQKSGRIINISSVAGLIAIPYQAMYSSSKFALEALTECLRMETADFGIKVSLVEPGDTRTGFTGSRLFTGASGEGSAYGEKFKRSISTMVRDELNGPGPEAVARAVMKVVKSKNPPVRLTVGFSYKLLLFIKRFLPSRLAVYIVSRLYG